MIEECRWCAKAQSEAANKVARYLMDRSRPVTRDDADYMQAYVRLCHRIDLAREHSSAGRILEELLDSHETLSLCEADALESEDPIEYPDDVQALLTMIEGVVAREDIQRYRGILDALVAELEEDGSL